MGTDQAAPAPGAALAQGRPPAGRRPLVPRGHPVGAPQRGAVEGPAARPRLPVAADLLASPGPLGAGRRVAKAVGGVPRRAGRAGPAGLVRVLRRRDVRAGKKGGRCVGKTKRGKGSKLVVVVDGGGVPLALTVHSASPAEP